MPDATRRISKHGPGRKRRSHSTPDVGWKWLFLKCRDASAASPLTGLPGSDLHRSGLSACGNGCFTLSVWFYEIKIKLLLYFFGFILICFVSYQSNLWCFSVPKTTNIIFGFQVSDKFATIFILFIHSSFGPFKKKKITRKGSRVSGADKCKAGESTLEQKPPPVSVRNPNVFVWLFARRRNAKWINKYFSAGFPPRFFHDQMEMPAFTPADTSCEKIKSRHRFNLKSFSSFRYRCLFYRVIGFLGPRVVVFWINRRTTVLLGAGKSAECSYLN